MKRIEVKNTGIVTIWDLCDAVGWCIKTFGEPGTRWKYGKYHDELGGDHINTPAEIKFFDFADEKDAVFFLLRW